MKVSDLNLRSALTMTPKRYLVPKGVNITVYYRKTIDGITPDEKWHIQSLKDVIVPASQCWLYPDKDMVAIIYDPPIPHPEYGFIRKWEVAWMDIVHDI